MRALRFSSVLGFSCPRDSRCRLSGKEPSAEVAVERVREELLKLLCGRCVVPALLQYAEVLGVVLPEILPAVGCDQRNIHHCYDVGAYCTYRGVCSARCGAPNDDAAA